MALLQIVRLGHPALRKKSASVTRKELFSKKFQSFLDDLVETCLKASGVGIAAPQVGINKRVIVVYVDPNNPRYPNRKPFPLTTVINPKVVSRSTDFSEDWEGDLSVDLRGVVPRARRCMVEGIDRTGKQVKFTFTDEFHSRIFQHEIDHLDGKMFIDKVKHMESLSETAEWKKYWKDKTVPTNIKKSSLDT